jgi:hypothetical protein
MSRDEVANAISEACEKCGEMSLLETKLEDCNPVVLDVRVGMLDDHVSIQPAAIAFFGSLLKDAERTLVRLKHEYERWGKKKYAEAKAALAGSGAKTTVGDIEAKVVEDNEVEIVKYEGEIAEAQRVYDELDVWYEAWRQKSYSMTQHANLLSDEMNSASSMGQRSDGSVETKETFQERKARVRALMGKSSGE